MKTAKLIKDNITEYNGYASLYYLSEPVSYFKLLDTNVYYTNYVICSKLGGKNDRYGFIDIHETFMFAANENGEIITYNELAGSVKGEATHEEVLLNAGFVLVREKYQTSKIKLNINLNGNC